MQLVLPEGAFRTLKGDPRLRPIYHHKPERTEARLSGTFLAGGLMPRVVLEKLATLQLLDLRVPSTDGREFLIVRRTGPGRGAAAGPTQSDLATATASRASAHSRPTESRVGCSGEL